MRALCLLVLVIVSVCAAVALSESHLSTPRGLVTFNASLATSLQRYFRLERRGWLGSDVATSIPVPSSSLVIWLWGDTLLGSLYRDSQGAWRRNVTGMPRNAIATQRVTPLASTSASTSSGGGHVISPLVWSIRYNASEPLRSAFFEPRNLSLWYWPTSGVVHEGALYALAYETYSTKAATLKRDLSFGFVRSVILAVKGSDLSADPLTWRYEAIALPHTGNALQWCTSALVQSPHLVLFGATVNATVLARIALTDLASAPPLSEGAMEYWALNEEGEAQWTRDATRPLQALFGSTRISETSVAWNSALKSFYALNIVYGQYAIEISFAPRVTGPWSEWQTLYQIPAPWNNASLGVFDYAPKSHPEYAQSDRELIVSYVSNTLALEPLFDDPRIYAPQFIRVNF